MAEARGFSGLYRSDHFTMPDPPDEDSLECVVSLAYLADHSSRVRFGPLVAPLSFRDPVMLARQAAALDDLSGGRMVLGVGTGWLEREHSLFGYELEDLQTRFAYSGAMNLSRMRGDSTDCEKPSCYHVCNARVVRRS